MGNMYVCVRVYVCLTAGKMYGAILHLELPYKVITGVCVCTCVFVREI